MTPKDATALDAQVGFRITALRKAHGMSQTELGTALGVSFQQVQKYEKGRNRVPSSRLAAISGIFNVSTTELFGQDPSTADPEVIELLAAFGSITDAGVRRACIETIKAIASANRNDQGDRFGESEGFMKTKIRPEGAILGKENFPKIGDRVWLVCKLTAKKQWIEEGIVREAPLEYRDNDRFFGIEKVVDGQKHIFGESLLDHNVIPNTYNDHYAFTDEVAALRYYEAS